MISSKLEYMIKNINIKSKKDLIYKIDYENCLDFFSLASEALLKIDTLDPSISKVVVDVCNPKEVMIFKRRYTYIFEEINQICIDNKICPLFKDPYNLKECEETRLDLIAPVDEEVLNEYFNVKSFYDYNPPVYKNTILYPAIIEKDEESDGWNVTVPDIFGGVTCGSDYDDAIYMAKDMIKLMLTEAPGQCFPPKTLEETKSNFPDKIVVMIEVNLN